MRVLCAMAMLLWAVAASAEGQSASVPAPSLVLSAEDVWVREVPPVAPAAALFARLHNASSESLAIVAFSSAAAERVEWHDMTMREGHMRMMQRAQVTLPPGETVLKPGASHLMLIGLQQPLRVGDALPVTLHLANGETLVLNAVVRATQPMMQSAPAEPAHAH